MRPLATIILSGAIGVLSMHSAAWAEDPNTRTASMPYADCLSIIAETAEELGEPPVQLAKTDDETTVRINASDGFVTVSCNRASNRIVLSKSPVPSAAGMTAAR